MSERMRKIFAVILVIASLAALLWCGFAILQTSRAGQELAPEFRWAVLPIICASCFVLILLLFSTVFSLLNLTEPNQALGLPDGSIRAIIALVLLGMFIIVPISLYVNMGGSEKKIENVAEADKEAFLKSSGGQYVRPVMTTPGIAGKKEVVAAAAAPGKPAIVSAPAVDAVPARYTIYYRDVNPAKDDFAKMILTALITLVSAVSSFFFGAQTVKSAQASNFAQTKDLLRPPSPTITLTASPADQQAVLTWTPYPGASAYNVYRSETSGAQGTTPIKDNVTGMAFTDIGRTNGTAYYYKVSASIATGEVLSNEVSVTPKA